MTTNTAPSPSPDEPDTPSPPQDYGNGDTWADDGPWAVSVVLRPFYAVAEPPPIELQGYLQNGVDVVEEQTAERLRVVDPGDDVRPPTTITEAYTVDCLVHKHGAEYYPTWLHLVRLRVALRAKAAADAQAGREAAWLICAMCKSKSPHVKVCWIPSDHVIAHTRRLPFNACPDHRAALEYTARHLFAAQDADRLLPDGRRAGDVAAELIRDRLDDAS